MEAQVLNPTHERIDSRSVICSNPVISIFLINEVIPWFAELRDSEEAFKSWSAVLGKDELNLRNFIDLVCVGGDIAFIVMLLGQLAEATNT